MFSVTNYSGFGTPARAGTASTPFDPATVAGLLNWVDFSDLTKQSTASISSSLSTFVAITSIIDKKSLGTWTGTTTISAGTNTTYRTPAVGTLSGLQVADFNYTTGTLNAGGGLRLAIGWMQNPGTFATSGQSQMSYAIVASYNSTVNTVDSYVFMLDPVNGPGAYVRFGGGGTQFSEASFVGDNLTPEAITLLSSPGTQAGWHILVGTGGVPNINLRADGGSVIGTDTLNGTSALRVRASIGAGGSVGGQRLLGQIAEVRYFTTCLSTDDIFKEEGYLAWKWGLQAKLPIGHPYKNAPP